MRQDGADSHQGEGRLIQRYAAKIGLDPGTVGGHLLTAGFLKEAARNRAAQAGMQEVPRQKKV